MDVNAVRQVGQDNKMNDKGTLDERLPALFEPDTLLPVQYFEAMHRKHVLEGEKRLILSVLEDAIECFTKCIDATSTKGQKLFREAEAWIDLEDKHWVFSFDNVCEMLDINPAYMRRGLRRWKERKLLELAGVRAAAEAATHAPVEPAAAKASGVAAAQKSPEAAAAPTVRLTRRTVVSRSRDKRGSVSPTPARKSRLRKARA